MKKSEIEKYLALLKSISIAKSQINQLEGELDFLVERLSTSYAQDFIPVAEKLLADPDIAKNIGVSLVEETLAAIREAKDEPPIDRKNIILVFSKMNRELRALHEKQIFNYQKAKAFIRASDGELLGSYEGERAEEAITKSIEAYARALPIIDRRYSIVNSRL